MQGIGDMVTIRVKQGTRDRLDGTVTQLKKHRHGRVTHDDAIQNLYEKVTQQNTIIRDLKEKLTLMDSALPTKPAPEQALSEPQKSAPVEHPIRTPSEHAKCPHYSVGDDVVLCGKDYDKKGIIHKVPEPICMQCWQRNKEILIPKKEGDIQNCLCRYEHAGEYFCVKNPPRAVKLAHALKTCSVCPDRLTKERAESLGLILTTRKYVICGAVEKQDEKAGTLLMCPRASQWTNIRQCEEIECSQFKTIQATIGKGAT